MTCDLWLPVVTERTGGGSEHGAFKTYHGHFQREFAVFWYSGLKLQTEKSFILKEVKFAQTFLGV